MNGPQAGNTLIVVTYDEFGGQWDHVPPPSTERRRRARPVRARARGSRRCLIARSFTKSGVDHTYYDTLSIMRTIEHQFGLDPVDARGGIVPRDGLVADLGKAVSTGRMGH